MAIRRDILEKKYSFEYEVGQWTLGTVSVLRLRETGALKTCKTVPKCLLRNCDSVLPRVNALRELKHPHICSITDAKEDHDNIYIISDFCAGGEVSEWISRLDEGYWVQEQTCVSYIRQALLALTHSHSARIYHRDLSPSTMHLTSKLPDARVKILDLGLAAILDPDNSLAQRQPSPYTAPEVLSSSGPMDGGVSDMYSIGAIAHALLVGRPPSRINESGTWFRMQPSDDESTESAWAERSPQSRDFVLRLLRPVDQRSTPARALQHPWLKGIPSLGGPNWATDVSQDARELRHKTLCYMLAVLLVPAMLPFRDFEQLRVAFQRCDSDCDGIISQATCSRLLLTRCQLREAVDAALEVVDIPKLSTLDLCSATAADIVAREFFGNGPTSQPLVGPLNASDLAPRMLKSFFEVYGDRKQPVTSVNILRTRLRTATARDFEQFADVAFEEILGDLPENCQIDSQTLVSHLSASEGRGTPLASSGDLSPIRQGSITPWGSGAFSFMNMFQNCGVGSGSTRREESPHSVNVLVR